MEWWGTLLISLASTIVGSFLTHFFTVRRERRKEKREYAKEMAKIRAEANEKKPRLEIKNYAGFGVADKFRVLRKEKPLNLLALGILGFEDINGKPTFKYDDRALDKNNYVCVEYYLVNTGLTEIDEICFTSNLPKTMALFQLDTGLRLVENKILNYEAWHEQRYIKPGERILVRIYYIKDMIPTTILGSPELTIWLRGVNGYIWRQSLYAPTEQIEYPIMSDDLEFKDAKDVSKAIECFRDSRLW